MRFTTEQWVRAPLSDVFEFFCAPGNLLNITPPEAHARIVSLDLVPIPGHAPELAGVGSTIRIDFRAAPFLNQRLGWTARIVELEWLRFFRDVQTAGPFRRFEHTHSFRAEDRRGSSGTVIRDEVNYELGLFGLLGSAAARPMLWRMFHYRHKVTRKLLEGRGQGAAPQANSD
ncbi:MAG TPA: SRPBCC family protein [Terriglobales bacterium]|nr:SRPBCC family protein [Terriglobales bacterium]